MGINDGAKDGEAEDSSAKKMGQLNDLIDSMFATFETGEIPQEDDGKDNLVLIITIQSIKYKCIHNLKIAQQF